MGAMEQDINVEIWELCYTGSIILHHIPKFKTLVLTMTAFKNLFGWHLQVGAQKYLVESVD